MSYDFGEFDWKCTACIDDGVVCIVRRRMPSGCIETPKCPWEMSKAIFEKIGFRCIDDPRLPEHSK